MQPEAPPRKPYSKPLKPHRLLYGEEIDQTVFPHIFLREIALCQHTRIRRITDAGSLPGALLISRRFESLSFPDFFPQYLVVSCNRPDDSLICGDQRIAARRHTGTFRMPLPDGDNLRPAPLARSSSAGEVHFVLCIKKTLRPPPHYMLCQRIFITDAAHLKDDIPRNLWGASPE